MDMYFVTGSQAKDILIKWKENRQHSHTLWNFKGDSQYASVQIWGIASSNISSSRVEHIKKSFSVFVPGTPNSSIWSTFSLVFSSTGWGSALSVCSFAPAYSSALTARTKGAETLAMGAHAWHRIYPLLLQCCIAVQLRGNVAYDSYICLQRFLMSENAKQHMPLASGNEQ